LIILNSTKQELKTRPQT